ncbi:hypothetical protein LJC44_01530 [Parabacteroides sp. OttesenSCG-928-G06]|nr:hypothetical protein [Parabacteroides sp. OttesenSCG-928-G06]
MKKLKSTLFVLVCLLFSINLNAQYYDSFDLKKYYTPDIVRNELDLNFNSEGFSNKNDDDDTHYLKGDVSGYFMHLKNTRKFVGQHLTKLRYSGELYKNTENNQKKNTHDITLEYTNISKIYFPNKMFFHTGGELSTGVNRNKANDIVDKDIFLDISIPLMVGYGRIEDVTDARQAIYILDNLSKNKVLKRTLTEEEVFVFSQIISRVKNKRFLDSRLRLIDEIATVDSFFVDNGLITESSATYFTTLYDYWMYGDRFKRGAGYEIEAGIKPAYSYFYSKYGNGSSKNNYPVINAIAAFSYEKPVNLYWQNSINATLMAQYADYKPKNAIHSKDYQLALSGTYMWGYYPTSRTNINMGITETAALVKQKMEDNYGEISRGYINTSLFLKAYYYFSPQLRLSADVAFQHQYQKRTGTFAYSDDLFAARYNLSLTYSIF